MSSRVPPPLTMKSRKNCSQIRMRTPVAGMVEGPWLPPGNQKRLQCRAAWVRRVYSGSRTPGRQCEWEKHESLTTNHVTAGLGMPRRAAVRNACGGVECVRPGGRGRTCQLAYPPGRMTKSEVTEDIFVCAPFIHPEPTAAASSQRAPHEAQRRSRGPAADGRHTRRARASEQTADWAAGWLTPGAHAANERDLRAPFAPCAAYVPAGCGE